MLSNINKETVRANELCFTNLDGAVECVAVPAVAAEQLVQEAITETAVQRTLQDSVDPTTINANAAVTSDDKKVEDDASCPDANPLVPTSDALLVLLLNIFIPGVGSMVAAYRSVDGFNSKCCGFGIG